MKILLGRLPICALAIVIGCGPHTQADEPDAKYPDLEETLKNAQVVDCMKLFLASAAAVEKKRFSDGVFLYYAGQIRAGADLKVFPAVGTGGNSPGVAISAVNGQLGFALNPIAMRDRDRYGKALERLQKWTPQYPEGYDPGWDYKEQITEAKRKEVVKETKGGMLDSMRKMKKLLANDEYFALVRRMQEANLPERLFQILEGEDFEVPEVSADEYQAMTKRGAEIEKELGIEGPLTEQVRAQARIQEILKNRESGDKDKDAESPKPTAGSPKQD